MHQSLQQISAPPPESASSETILQTLLGSSVAARATVETFGSLLALSRVPQSELVRLAGLSQAQASAVTAAFELGWRLLEEKASGLEVFHGSEQIFRFFAGKLAHESVEVVWLLLLDTRLRRLAAVELARGARNGAIVHPSEVFRKVVVHGASAFVLVHNHPSGDPDPSQADLALTQDLVKLANLMRVDFLDHLILAGGAFYSFADHRRI